MTRGALASAAVFAVVVTTVAALSGKEETKPPAKVEHPRRVTHCADGGLVACDALETGKKPKYRRVKVGTEDCASYLLFSDGGVEVEKTWRNTKSPRKGLEIVGGSCASAANIPATDDGGVAFVAQECACRKAKGACWILSDAGAMEAPFRRTLGPGYPGVEVWAGEGCVPKACVELMGASSWPSECPR